MGARTQMRVVLALLVLGSPAAIAQAGSPRTTHTGVYSAAQAERGKMEYAVSCRSCHTAASHTGVTFAKWWKDRTLADLFGYVSTQMPKNDPGSLDSDRYADVVAYLLAMNAMPAGRADLPPDSSALAQIRIVLPPPPTKKSGRKPAAGIPIRKASH
jgi:S-disulfanyl-L-cysteine oxidoreductase SoxD